MLSRLGKMLFFLFIPFVAIGFLLFKGIGFLIEKAKG